MTTPNDATQALDSIVDQAVGQTELVNADEALNAAIAQAQEDDAAQAAATRYDLSTAVDDGPLVPQTAPQNTAVFVPTQPATSWDDGEDSDGTLLVEKWVSPTETGVLIDEVGAENALVRLRFTQEALPRFMAIVYGPEGATQRAKSYDGVTGKTGESLNRNWAGFVAEVQQTWPKAAEYRGVDLTMTLLEPVKSSKGTIPKGTILGFSTPKTSYRQFSILAKKAQEAGLYGQELVVRLGGVSKSYNGLKWKEMTFELVGPLENSEWDV